MLFFNYLITNILSEHLLLKQKEQIEIVDYIIPNKPYKCSIMSSNYKLLYINIYYNNILMESSKEDSIHFVFYPKMGEVKFNIYNPTTEDLIVLIKTSTTEKISQIGEGETGDELTRELESSLRLTINAQSEELNKLTFLRQKINRMKNYIKLFMICELIACVALIYLMNKSSKEILMKK